MGKSRLVLEFRRALAQAVEQSAIMQQLAYYPLWIAHLSEAYLLSGRLEDACQRAEQALALSRGYKQRGHEAYALRLLGDIAAHSVPPEVEQAEAFYRQAIALADELGMRPLLAHCHSGLGILYNRIGRLEQSHTELSAAIELYRAMAMTFWLDRAETALVQGHEKGT
jgi:tetratricopeptide (TPR) repeat protein